MPSKENPSMLIPSSPDENQRDVADFFHAVIKNDAATVETLLNTRCIDVNRLNSTKKTALYLAIQNENLTIVRVLIVAGADLNRKSFCNAHNCFELPLVTAAHVHNLELVQLLITSGCGSEKEYLKDGKSALQWAAGYGDITLASMLLNHGSDLNWIGPFLQTVLHFAALSEQRDMVDWLLERKAEITINGEQRSPLHIASVKGNLPIVRSLLEYGARPDELDAYESTPFSLACLRGHIEVVKHFAAVCPRNELSTEAGLVCASEFGYDDVIRFLLDDLQTNVDSTISSGETALIRAAKNSFSTTLLLLEHDACIEVADKRGLTPLTMSMMRGHKNIAARLIQHGATLEHVHKCDTAPESPLRIAFNMSNASLLKYMIEAGVHLCQEPWFNVKAAEQKIVELDFSIPRTPDYRRNIDLQKDLWKWIEQRIGNPRSLRELARRVIRKTIVKASGGRSVINRLHFLPLPPTLLQFVSLGEIMLD